MNARTDAIGHLAVLLRKPLTDPHLAGFVDALLEAAREKAPTDHEIALDLERKAAHDPRN